MFNPKMFETIKENINEVIHKNSELGQELWNEILKLHPADLEELISHLDTQEFQQIYAQLPVSIQIKVFEHLSENLQIDALEALTHEQKMLLLNQVPPHEIADFTDHLSDEELKDLFKLMHKKYREQVLSLMQFGPESAGGIMDTDVIAFIQDITVEKAIQILQKIQPTKEIHQQIYITDNDNRLTGYINLEDLVLKKPHTPLHTILKKPEYIAHVNTDQEDVAQKMVHYHLSSVPVVGEENKFLGMIPSDTLVDVLEEEASEDVYRMSAMAPIKHTYFETPFLRLMGERSFILVALLLVESISSTILESYEHTLESFFLLAFLPMIVSVGGNTSGQTSALAIQGLTSGEINFSNAKKFFKREITMSLAIAPIIGIVAFLRVYLTRHNILTSVAVGGSLMLIVTLSITLGSLLPLALKKFKIDPAFSAGPFLATIMDILGSLIFCYIAKLILG